MSPNSTADLTSLSRGGGSGVAVSQAVATSARGYVAMAPADDASTLIVIVPEFSTAFGHEVPSGQWEHAANLPAPGAACLVIFDDHGDVWVPTWDGMVAGGGGTPGPEGPPGPTGPQGPAGPPGSGGGGAGAVAAVAARAAADYGSSTALTAGWSKLALNSTTFDTSSLADLTNHRIVVAQDGYYDVAASATVTPGGPGWFGVGVYVNGTLASPQGWAYSQPANPLSSLAMPVAASDKLSLHAGDVLELYAFSSADGSTVQHGNSLAAELMGGASPTYTFTQVSPSATWTVTHNLNKHPSVTIVDSGDTELLADLHYASANQLVLTFGAPTSGKVYLN